MKKRQPPKQSPLIEHQGHTQRKQSRLKPGLKRKASQETQTPIHTPTLTPQSLSLKASPVIPSLTLGPPGHAPLAHTQFGQRKHTQLD